MTELKSKSASPANILGCYQIGGLVGSNSGTISNCYATGVVDGYSSIGGLVGSNYNTIVNCHAAVTVSGVSLWTGGLVGLNNGRISNCDAAGPVDGNDETGGLVGRNNEGTISDCYATGSVSGNDYTGGLVGLGGGILDSYATGNINGNNRTGGLLGFGWNILNCYATGDVNGIDCTGGLVGAGRDISNCYATGTVKGNYLTGGLAGVLVSGIISNCYATGAVDGNVFTGGLVGRIGSVIGCGVISNCYSVGPVDGVDLNSTGGLVGANFCGYFTKCFWDSDVNPDVNGIGNIPDPNVIGKSTTEMQTESTFTSAGWDFVGETANGSDDIWKMCYVPDYPHLFWEQCPKPSLEMPMHFTPRMLNPKSKGKWVKAHFILPESFAVEDVNTNSPAKIVEPFMADSNYMDVFINEDDLVEIEVAFDRAIFCSNGSMLEDIVVIAQLATGQYFYGTNTIRIKTNNLEYLAVLTSHWHRTDCKKPHWCEGSDINQDGTVNFVDFAFFDGCCFEFIQK